MAGKARVFASPRLGYAIDKLSKNTLIDLVVDRVRAELGEDACDDAIASVIQDWIAPVCRERGDKAPSLMQCMLAWDLAAEKHQEWLRRNAEYEASKAKGDASR